MRPLLRCGGAVLATLLPVLSLGTTRAPAAAQDPGTDLLAGTVVSVVGETPARGAETRTLAVLSPSGMVPLDPTRAVAPGDAVTLRVAERPDGAATVRSVLSRRAGAPATAAPTTATRQVYLALVSPAGHSVASNTNTVAGVRSTLDQASTYWSAQTGGQVRFALAGSLPAYQSAYDCSNPYGMWNEALERFRAAGTEAYGPRRHLLVVVPNGLSQTDGCAYGFGTLGSLGDAPGNAVFVSDRNRSLYAHELGHNLGLDHANALRCPAFDGAADAQGTFPGCSREEYDDLLDVMGYSGAGYGEGSLNVAHRDDLGLETDRIVTVPADTVRTVRIAALTDDAAPVRGIRVRDPRGGWYFVEYRVDAGWDHAAVLNPWRPSLGVLVTRDDPRAYDGHGSLQLDASPTSHASDYQRSLPVGSTVRTAGGAVSLRVVGADAGGASVEVSTVVPVGSPDDPTADPTPVPDRAARVTIGAPSRVRLGSRVRFVARVFGRTAEPVAQVGLRLETYRNHRWVTVRRVRSDERGIARATYTTRHTSRFRFVTADGLASAVRTLRVRS